jgi:hypothetical protein
MLALGADFLGITRSLLSLLPQETIDNSKIDRVFAARGFKRHVDEEDEYEFRYPQVRLGGPNHEGGSRTVMTNTY